MPEVFDELRAAILRGEYAPRQRLIEPELHAEVRRIAGHGAAAKVIDQLHGQMVRHQFRLALLPGRPAVSLPEHLAIVEAVCARDPARAEAAMGAHLDSVLRMLTSFSADVIPIRG
ncbi:FCD domain-containing protein [Dactylosporangium sp. NPDC049140]|uniref:FCD domain-containing protein n=1 Tax=Dactylosporangium sp. NPDC049140 TaxID=3155647 RepID=UPI0033CA1381